MGQSHSSTDDMEISKEADLLCYLSTTKDSPSFTLSVIFSFLDRHPHKCTDSLKCGVLYSFCRLPAFTPVYSTSSFSLPPPSYSSSSSSTSPSSCSERTLANSLPSSSSLPELARLPFLQKLIARLSLSITPEIVGVLCAICTAEEYKYLTSLAPQTDWSPLLSSHLLTAIRHCNVRLAQYLVTKGADTHEVQSLLLCKRDRLKYVPDPNIPVEDSYPSLLFDSLFPVISSQGKSYCLYCQSVWFALCFSRCSGVFFQRAYQVWNAMSVLVESLCFSSFVIHLANTVCVRSSGPC